MSFESYELQLLVAIGKGCRPNSPKPYRAWCQVVPLPGIPQYGNTLAALVRAGLLHRGKGFSVKPSAKGYALIGRWKVHRYELKQRPILYDRIVWDQPIQLEFQQAA